MTVRTLPRHDHFDCHRLATRGTMSRPVVGCVALFAVFVLLADSSRQTASAATAADQAGAAATAKPQSDKAKPAAAAVRPKGKKLFDGKTLKGWEVTDFGGQGVVRVEEKKLILGAGEMLTGVTWKGPFPKTNFEVELEAMRVDGSDFFCGLTVPVGKGSCSLILGGWGGTLTGISCINHGDASENETTQFIRYESGRWYKVRLRVSDKKVQAWLDAKKIIDVDREDKQFEVRIEVELSLPFGIAAFQTTAAMRNITLRPVRGPAVDRQPNKE